MLSLNLVTDEWIINLHSWGEGVLHYATFHRDTMEGNSSVQYFETTQEADEQLVLDAALLIEQGYRLDA